MAPIRVAAVTLAPAASSAADQLEIAVVGGPVEGGGAVAVGDVDVGALGDQRANAGGVALHRGQHDLVVGGGGEPLPAASSTPPGPALSAGS